MSVYGLMRTGASGMGAQSDRLATVADNIANSSTVGYKSASTEFSSLLISTSPSSYSSGGVETATRYGISKQGTLSFTSSPFDLAINGNGFFAVSDADGTLALTRAGGFVPDGDGQLVNSAGYRLMGFQIGQGALPLENATASLVSVSVKQDRLEAVATTTGELTVNLPSTSAVGTAATLPSANTSNSIASSASSLVVYDKLGKKIVLDVAFAKTGSNDWEISIFNSADRSTNGTFPYASAPLSVTTLSFDSEGQLAPAGPHSAAVPIPGGAILDLDLTNTSQLDSEYAVLKVQSNGSAASQTAGVTIDSDGTVSEVYDNGSRRATFRIPIAAVASPDRLIERSGNIFEISTGPGDFTLGTAGKAGTGEISSGALENSTVDIAQELTEMIEAQRNYTANSKVFQTGAELLETLVNLKR